MVSNLKKSRAQRGHVSAGHGRVGKHRKHPGGRGNAGGQHHHRIAFDKYQRAYFGKVGMRHYHKTTERLHQPYTNLDRIWALIRDSTSMTKYSNQNKIPVIDVTKYGFHKVLGKGNLPSRPFVLRTFNLSKLAEKKIKAVGGATLVLA